MKIYGRDKQHPKGYPGLGLPKGVEPWWMGEMGDHSKKRARREGKEEIESEKTICPCSGPHECDKCEMKAVTP